MSRHSAWIAAGAAAILSLGWVLTAGPSPAFQQPGAGDRTQDRDAILRAAKEFAKAFENRDARGVASFWTENGEYENDGGDHVIGRAAIEKAFAEYFQHRPKGTTIDIRPEAIRFPSRDTAIETGLLVVEGAGKEMPTSTWYSTTHVRENGQWKIAHSREWGGDVDRLADLEWLIGTWKGGDAKDEMTLVYAKDKAKPVITGSFATKIDGKVVTEGTFRIAFDPQRKQIRSWHFDEFGGHGQALWHRDGDRWVMDSVGVLPDGSETASVNVLHRVNRNEIVWQSIDRVAHGWPLPESKPVKLTRVTK